jgi:hypothetical protein
MAHFHWNIGSIVAHIQITGVWKNIGVKIQKYHLNRNLKYMEELT